MKVKALFFSTLFFFSLAATSIAQKTQIYVDKEADYKLALELFNKEKYSAAQRSFLDIIEKMPAQSEVSINIPPFAPWNFLIHMRSNNC